MVLGKVALALGAAAAIGTNSADAAEVTQMKMKVTNYSNARQQRAEMMKRRMEAKKEGEARALKAQEEARKVAAEQRKTKLRELTNRLQKKLGKGNGGKPLTEAQLKRAMKQEHARVNVLKKRQLEKSYLGKQFEKKRRQLAKRLAGKRMDTKTTRGATAKALPLPTSRVDVVKAHGKKINLKALEIKLRRQLARQLQVADTYDAALHKNADGTNPAGCDFDGGADATSTGCSASGGDCNFTFDTASNTCSVCSETENDDGTFTYKFYDETNTIAFRDAFPEYFSGWTWCGPGADA